jgi:hypothetical protein
MSKIKRLALVRHGESIGNVEMNNNHSSVGNWETTDWALSETGWEQGRLAGQWLQDLDIALSDEETCNGDILLYSRQNTSGFFTQKQHYSPTRGMVFDSVSINENAGASK